MLCKPEVRLPEPAPQAAPRARAARKAQRDTAAKTPESRPFNLLRWYSIASLLALLPVAAITGSILAHFVTQDALERDALLTAQFIQNCLSVETEQFKIESLARMLDPRADVRAAGLDPRTVAQARSEMFDHLGSLSEALLTNLYARDGRVVWSSNPSLVGTNGGFNLEVQQAFATKAWLPRHRAGHATELGGQPFVAAPEDVVIENYIPLLDAKGEPAAVVQVYKEPHRLMASIRAGTQLVWATTLLGGLLIYLVLFGIVRRGSRMLSRQQEQLMEKESQLFAGEMATALAHSLRNPLACVRTSAELALDADDAAVRKNAQDIITQVDFLSKWARELLLYSQPLRGEEETVDLGSVLSSVLASFTTSFERAGIRVVWKSPQDGRRLVEGNTSLVTQALHSVICNAVEAMPKGGELRIELRDSWDPVGVQLVVSDTGMGMSKQQLATAFRPFNTTKSHGLGIGLPLLKRAMERFGGFVTLSSVENAGTQVCLHFKA